MASSNHHDYAPVHLGADEPGDETTLQKIRTAGSISISPELFERLYLNPQTPVKGDLRQTFANPTAVGIIGFLISLTPLSCDLMGWRGSGDFGAADITAYIWFGGLCLIVSGILEFFLGNSFTFTAFVPFGAFYLTFGTALQPFYNTYADYGGLKSAGFFASFGFFFLFFGILCFYYLICSLRTNVVFVYIFATVTPAVQLVAAALWYGAKGDMDMFNTLLVSAGALLFACCMGGWYLLLALMLPTVDFPFVLPLGDLSHVIPGKSDLAKRKQKDVPENGATKA